MPAVHPLYGLDLKAILYLQTLVHIASMELSEVGENKIILSLKLDNVFFHL